VHRFRLSLARARRHGTTTSLPLPTTPPLLPRLRPCASSRRPPPRRHRRRRHGHPRGGGHRRPLHLFPGGTRARPLLPRSRPDFALDLRDLVMRRRNAALARLLQPRGPRIGPGSLLHCLFACLQSFERLVKWEGFCYRNWVSAKSEWNHEGCLVVAYVNMRG